MYLDALDAVDQKIVALLIENARSSYSEIGEKLGLSRVAIKNHIDALEAQGVQVRVQTAITMQQIAEPYIRSRAIRHFEKGRVVVFGCGTGNPFFSTDTASSLRAAEIDADIILKATMVDGVYDCDPNIYPNAVKYDEVTFQEVLEKGLKVMDSTAAAMCKDNHIPVLVFSLSNPDNILSAIKGEKIGTIVKED